MTDELNLELSNAALEIVKAGIEYRDDNLRFSYELEKLTRDTTEGIYGLFAGVLDLSITLLESLAASTDEPVETILAMLEESNEERWGQ
jgi:hypothetical protein